MRACKKCLENNWTFEYIDGWIKATCNCGMVEQFQALKKQPQELREGAPCRKCSKPITLRKSKFRQKKLKKAYYYNAYYWCAGCRTIYYDPKYKVLNPAAMAANIEEGLRLGNQYNNAEEVPIDLSPDAENVRRKRHIKLRGI